MGFFRRMDEQWKDNALWQFAKFNLVALTITATKGLEEEGKDKKGKIVHQERYSGSMSRSFYLGEHVTEEDVKAKFENGVLTLGFPKEEPKKLPERKTILIEG